MVPTHVGLKNWIAHINLIMHWKGKFGKDEKSNDNRQPRILCNKRESEIVRNYYDYLTVNFIFVGYARFNIFMIVGYWKTLHHGFHLTIEIFTIRYLIAKVILKPHGVEMVSLPYWQRQHATVLYSMAAILCDMRTLYLAFALNIQNTNTKRHKKYSPSTNL